MLVALHDQLSDAITLLNMKRSVPVIEQNDPKFALIVPVDDPGTHLNAVLYGQTRATGDACIAPLGDLDADTCGNHETLALVDHTVRAGI